MALVWLYPSSRKRDALKFGLNPAVLLFAALSLMWCSFGFQMQDFASPDGSKQLGYSGSGVEVIALYEPSREAVQFDAGKVVDLFDLSIAYERQLNSGILTIIDPNQRFRTEVGPLLSDELVSEDGGSWIGFDERLLPSNIDIVTAIFPQFRGTLLEPVSSSLALMGSQQAAYVSEDLQPLIDGRYFFAGDYIETPEGVDNIIVHMESEGFAIVAVNHFPGAKTSTQAILQFITGRYVMVVFIFFVIATSAFLIVFHDEASKYQRSLTAMAVFGANRSQISRKLFLRLFNNLLRGGLCAILITSGIILLTQSLSSVPTVSRLIALAIMQGFTFLFAVLLIIAVVNRAMRKNAHVFPI